MKTTNGTPATTETPREQYLSECLTERREVLDKTRAEYFKLEQKCAALTAKAAALDALVEAVTLAAEALGVTAALDADSYQNTPGVDRAWEGRIIAFSAVEDAIAAALTAAKAAQASK